MEGQLGEWMGKEKALGTMFRPNRAHLRGRVGLDEARLKGAQGVGCGGRESRYIWWGVGVRWEGQGRGGRAVGYPWGQCRECRECRV